MEGNKCTTNCGCAVGQCVMHHDHAIQMMCNQQGEACRNTGTVWDPIPPFEEVKVPMRYYRGPGYTTQGAYIEHFGTMQSLFSLNTLLRGVLIALLVMASVYITAKKMGDEPNYKSLLMVGAISSVMAIAVDFVLL